MRGSLRLGYAFGIGIYVHWTFLFLPAWILFTTVGILDLPAIALLLTLLAAVFSCVVLHELGHALMARYFGIGTRDITLYPIGGVARLEQMSERPHEEVLIALAGPAVNVILATVLAVVVVATGAALGWQYLLRSLMGNFLISLLSANVLLVVFNLLPAFPMDGGRVLRAGLSTPLGRLRATELSAHLGAVVAVLMAAAGLIWFSNPMLLVVAGFVFFAGRAEMAAVRRNALEDQAKPVEMLEAETAFGAKPSAGMGFTGAIWDAQGHVWVVWRDGRPVAHLGQSSE